MKKNSLRHKEEVDIQKAHVVSFISFLLGFSAAFISYVIAYYFKEVTGSDNVGPFFFASFALELIVVVNLHKLIRKMGKSVVLHLAFLLEIATLVFLLFLPPGYLGAMLVVANILFANVLWVILDVILESFSSDSMSGRIRGIHLTIMNLGFLVGPLLAIMILEKYNFEGVFFVMLVLNVIAFLAALLFLSRVNHSYDRDLTITEVMQKVGRRKSIQRIYYLSVVLEFFYGIMVTFSSLYLLELGFSWSEIGKIFTIMLVPFVLLQFPIGYLADKKWGEKELLIASIVTMGTTVLLVYLTESRSVWVWAALLFATRIGAAMLEILRDSYFYKRIDLDDVDMIDFFRTARAIGYIGASIIATGMLALNFSLHSLYLMLAIVIFTGLVPALKISDNKAEEEMERG